MFEKYYTPEQLRYLRERAEQVGQQRMEEVQQEWHELISAVRREQELGTAPDSDRMQELSATWQSLIHEFTGGDPGIEDALRRMYSDSPNTAQQFGYDLDGEVMGYVGKAVNRASR